MKNSKIHKPRERTFNHMIIKLKETESLVVSHNCFKTKYITNSPKLETTGPQFSVPKLLDDTTVLRFNYQPSRNLTVSGLGVPHVWGHS